MGSKAADDGGGWRLCRCRLIDPFFPPYGKAAIHIARTYTGRRKNYTGQHFWARGYYVTTVGRDEAAIRAYIQRQEEEDKTSRSDGALVAASRL
jgi:hypothetical protein